MSRDRVHYTICYDTDKTDKTKRQEIREIYKENTPRLGDEMAKLLDDIKQLGPKQKSDKIKEWIHTHMIYDIKTTKKTNSIIRSEKSFLEMRSDHQQIKNKNNRWTQTTMKITQKSIIGVCVTAARIYDILAREAGLATVKHHGFSSVDKLGIYKGFIPHTLTEKNFHAFNTLLIPNEKGELIPDIVDTTPSFSVTDKENILNKLFLNKENFTLILLKYAPLAIILLLVLSIIESAGGLPDIDISPGDNHKLTSYIQTLSHYLETHLKHIIVGCLILGGGYYLITKIVRNLKKALSPTQKQEETLPEESQEKKHEEKNEDKNEQHTNTTHKDTEKKSSTPEETQEEHNKPVYIYTIPDTIPAYLEDHTEKIITYMQMCNMRQEQYNSGEDISLLEAGIKQKREKFPDQWKDFLAQQKKNTQ